MLTSNEIAIHSNTNKASINNPKPIDKFPATNVQKLYKGEIVVQFSIRQCFFLCIKIDDNKRESN